MKKLLTSVDAMLVEALRGFAAAHPDIVEINEDPAYIKRKGPPKPGKVALISGGGSGHEPLHGGFVGFGMLDAACPGQVFTSPTPDQMAAAAGAVDGGAGILWIVKNYAGDIMNFVMAAELVDNSSTVVTNDDAAVENSPWTQGLRAVACTALGERVNERTRSMGVALTSCTVPAAGKPTFELPEDEIEMGVGIHGEPGRRRSKLASADAIAEELMGPILSELELPGGAPVLLNVNGFGGTPLMELYLMYGAARRLVEDRGATVARALVGNFTTSLDMAGCSMTVTRLDDEMMKLWDAPVHTAALRWGC